MGLEYLIVRLRIEEDNRNMKVKVSKLSAKVNIVEFNKQENKRNFLDGKQQQQPKNQKKKNSRKTVITV